MTHGSLFSGIGGFDLAAEWMGWENIFHCEWNKFGQYNLETHFEKSVQHNDITKTDFTIYNGRIDVLTGGFPCQPYSTAGKRLGKADERHLWPEMLRAIREIAPRWVVGENVRGLVSWNGGMVFDEVQSDLESQGYEVLPFILPAAGVNAPHRRDRVWFVAYRSNAGIKSGGQGGKNPVHEPESITNTGCAGTIENAGGFSQSRELFQEAGREQNQQFNQSIGSERATSNPTSIRPCRNDRKREDRFQRGNRRETRDVINGNGSEGIAPHSSSVLNGGKGRKEETENGEGEIEINEQEGSELWDRPSSISGVPDWNQWPTQSPIRVRNDGLPVELLRQFLREDSNGLLSEKEINRLVSKARGKWRKETIKAAGNAIVPQVVHQIFKSIEQYEQTNNHE